MIKNAFYFSLSLLRIGGGGEWGWEGDKRPVSTSFSTVTSTNVTISPKIEEKLNKLEIMH